MANSSSILLLFLKQFSAASRMNHGAQSPTFFQATPLFDSPGPERAINVETSS
jgi:hypothetical protein